MKKFKSVGQRVEFYINSYINIGIILSYSNNFDGSITFETNKGFVKESQIIRFF